MKNSLYPSIIKVTDTEDDNQLIQEIAYIEQLVQPHDSWHQQTLKELLREDINHGWVVLTSQQPKTTTKQLSSEQATNNQVAAYCLFSTVFETAEILRIGTHPDYQRLGYAQALITQMMEGMADKGLEKILLEVRSDNTGAIKLYQKMGFVVIHTRKDYYLTVSKTGDNQRCDALIMQYGSQALEQK